MKNLKRNKKKRRKDWQRGNFMERKWKGTELDESQRDDSSQVHGLKRMPSFIVDKYKGDSFRRAIT